MLGARRSLAAAAGCVKTLDVPTVVAGLAPTADTTTHDLPTSGAADDSHEAASPFMLSATRFIMARVEGSGE